MNSTYILVLLVANFCSLGDCAAYYEYDSQSCKTWEGQSGECIGLPQCGYAINLIKSKSIRSKAVQDFLQRNQCGFAGYEPKVCCYQRKQESRDNHSTHNNIPATERPKYTNPLSLLARDCGLDESNRIIGGEVTALGEFPWLVVLEYKNDRQSDMALVCGGTLISKRYVLTAAHCIRNAPSYLHLRNVRLGEHDVRTDADCLADGTNGQRICADRKLSVPIERVIVHEGYGSPRIYRNDIALLRLSYAVEFTRFIKPICLPIDGHTSLSYWSAGWGAIENKCNSDTKLKVKLSAVDLNQCAAVYTTKGVILGQGQMCAGGNAGKDSCKGDSGGPLMRQMPVASGPHRWVIDGVVSIGPTPCGLAGWPGVYTKVQNYVRWLVSNLEP